MQFPSPLRSGVPPPLFKCYILVYLMDTRHFFSHSALNALSRVVLTLWHVDYGSSILLCTVGSVNIVDLAVVVVTLICIMIDLSNKRWRRRAEAGSNDKASTILPRDQLFAQKPRACLYIKQRSQEEVNHDSRISPGKRHHYRNLILEIL